MEQSKARNTFWEIFMVANGLAILVLVGTFVWAGFDIHNRIRFVMIAQGPPLVMMAIRRFYRG